MTFSPTLVAQDDRKLFSKIKLLSTNKKDLEIIHFLEDVFNHEELKKIHKIEDTARKIVVNVIEEVLKSSNNTHFKAIVYAKFSREAIHLKSTSWAVDCIKKSEKAMPKTNYLLHFYLHHKKHELYGILKRRDTALYYAKKMEEVAYQLKNDSLQALAQRSLASMFFGSKQYLASREAFKKIINYNIQHPTPLALHQNINFVNTIALTFRMEQRYDSAHLYYTRALDLATAQKDTAWIGIVTGNIADIYFLEKQYEKALPLFLKELKLVTRKARWEKRIDGRVIDGSTLNTVSRLVSTYLALGDRKNAKMYLDSAERNMPNQDLKSIKGVLEVAAEFYEKEGDFQKAYQYFRRYHAVTDSINNREAAVRINELNAQLNFDKQQKEIEQLHASAEKQTKESEQKTYMLFGVMAILGLSVGFIYFLYISNEKKKRINTQLHRQKTEITTQAEELNTQAEELKSLNEQLVELDQFKQNLTGMIVHDLKNPLNALLNLPEKPTPNQTQLVRNYSQQMLNMVMNMLDVQRFEEAKMYLDKQEMNIDFLVGEACRQVEFMLVQKNIQIEQKTPYNLYVWVDADILIRVFVNLLTNAIKYSPQNSKITIIAEKQDDSLSCRVQDEGKGIPQDKVDYIFQKFSRLENESRKNYHSTGLGLTFCKMAIEAHTGAIWVESEVGKGATFLFTLPHATLKEGLPTTQTTLKQEKETTNKFLSPQSITILQPFLPALSKLEVYYASELENILQQIDFSQTQDLQIWGEDLKNAIHNFNQEQYQSLLSQIT